MQVRELRELNDQQLQEELEGLHKELMGLRFQTATNQLVDTNQVRKTRRTIARILTIMKERGVSQD
ncbi:MAG: 50S ribosomal protein L29 [SAR202 cluster bacterium]|jgi:large subunit ribosomal protein L29|nr:MAG: 50S ribosomal protein L29 [SAR202 cluster bacterium]MBH38571.1 50S ribosomal protein L29 [Chloroflexota bacterium]MQG80352.1 50S ribosomal protein L29 [SAR202 cluster bacterium]